ncbi:YheV family putative zinc ribbon protein [Azotobacter salinestris]|uniref:YheV family putative zinc ribbon protein n=1 Tax=Azotobacter salinestris TaxID=69964 RepID=UPI001266A553|nr:YheV family putative zinc ribbon protein [Azotobacter salinestris]
MSGHKKQFIAGAVCPACETMDTVRMWNVDGVPHRECVSCSFADILNAQGLSVPLELGTRVNKAEAAPAAPAPAPAAPKVHTAQFFPNPKLKKP